MQLNKEESYNAKKCSPFQMSCSMQELKISRQNPFPISVPRKKYVIQYRGLEIFVKLPYRLSLSLRIWAMVLNYFM